MLRNVNGKYYIDSEEVTAEQYQSALSVIRSKSNLADEIIAGRKTIDEVPAEWADDVAAMIAARTEENPLPDVVTQQEIADALEDVL